MIDCILSHLGIFGCLLVSLPLIGIICGVLDVVIGGDDEY